MDADRYPMGYRVDVWWPGDKEWYSATVLKTRVESHTIAGMKTTCRAIFCDYDLDGHMQWHSLHNNDVRTCTSPSPNNEMSDVADPFPATSRIEVWWPGDACYYKATVLKTRTAWHSIKCVKTLTREIFCDYDLDGVMKWHSLHNTKVRMIRNGKTLPRTTLICDELTIFKQITPVRLNSKIHQIRYPSQEYVVRVCSRRIGSSHAG